MKIVEIINSLQHRGGAEVFASSLASAFQSQPEKHEIVFVSLFDKTDNSFLSLFKEKAISFFTCNKKRGFDLLAAKKLKKILKQIKPDIVHFHLSCLPTYFLAFGFSKQSWKLVQTFHTIPGKDVGGSTRLLRELYIKKKMIHFVGITDEITKIAVQTYPAISCHTIYNGISLPLKSDINPDYENREYDFVIIASLTPVKNHMLLFESIKELRLSYPKIKLLCVGGGPLFYEYSSFINDNNLKQNIILNGPAVNIAEMLNKSKCFVLSSTREGNPISILEAMSFGLPIIAPCIGGIPDVIKNKSGILFEANNLDELKKAMVYALENNEIMYELGLHNLSISCDFSIERCASEYLIFFKELFNL